MIRLWKILLVLNFLICSLSVNGQRARLFSTDAELSNSLIGDIYQDHKGIIWIATEGGINRYDGSKFTAFKEEDGILNNYVRVIFEDSNGNLFFGFFNGLQKYDRATDSFTTIPLLLEANGTYPAHILSAVERKDGTKLIGTSGHGIFQIIPTDSGLVAKQKSDLIPSYLAGYLYEDKNQNLWVATQDMGLFKIDKNGSTTQYYEPKNGIDNNISSICQDNNGDIFVGSIAKGLFRYNEANDQFDPMLNGDRRNLTIKVLYPIKSGQILVGTDGKGMKLYDPYKNQISDLNFNVSNFDFSKSKVHTIIEDEVGNFWLGLFQKGVALIPSRINNFQYIGYQSVTDNNIGSNYIMSVLKDRQGTLWVGTDSDGLYAISQKGEQLAHYSPSENDNSAPSTIMCMYEDSNNNFWVGSYMEGLFRFDRKTGSFYPVKNMLDVQLESVRNIYSITEDNNKNLWVGTLGTGLYSINLRSGEIKNYSWKTNPAYQNDATNYLHNIWISDILFDGVDKLYIGTTDGLSCFNLKTKTFTNLNNTYPELALQNVQVLHQDNMRRIWVGTSQGLLHLNIAEKSIDKYTVQDGLPSNVICAIENEENGNLWISTNYGISKFNPQDTSFVNYYYHDGLQGNEFSKRAVFKDQSGTFIFGGINGITYFKPEDIKDKHKDLEIIISDFYIHDRAVKKGMKSGKYEIIDTAVMEEDTFHLSHDDNSFTIEFSAMEYVNPKRITYLYSMTNENWISLQRGTNTVTFNNLEPGEYNFKVRAKDFKNLSEVRNLVVIIHPAWYFSTWAKAGYLLICALIIMGVVYIIHQRYETKKRIREHLHTRQINEAKLEFFTNISHEIRTPLSLILNPLKKLISRDDDSGRQKVYSTMRRNTERILHLVDQLMDLRKIDKGKINLKFRETDIVSFIHEVTEIFQEQLLAKHIRFRIHENGLQPKVWIDPGFFDKAIQNLLSNAIKFTPENGDIDLFIEPGINADDKSQSRQYLSITCIDSGIGINEDELDKIFDRFYQASHNQNKHIGSGIGLHLTRSIVELHHGKIHAENNTNAPGCKFVINIPLGYEHLNQEEIDRTSELSHKDPDRTIAPLPFETVDETHVKSKSKKRVLVVDDDEEVRKYICDELAPDYHIHECEDGKEALSFILSDKPDLVISDVMMPEMDGITLCRKVKQNVNINHIPVILLTARSGEKDNLEGLGFGADAYIAKPFNMDILKKTVENIIKNRELLKNNFSGNQLQKDKVKDIKIESADEKLMHKIMDVINKNMDNPALNVEMIASEIGISRVHLYRKLKELTNQSVRDLIRNVRLRQAAELLSTKNINISEAAYATGFSNPSKFSTSFKELYGMTPKSYIEKYQKGTLENQKSDVK